MTKRRLASQVAVVVVCALLVCAQAQQETPNAPTPQPPPGSTTTSAPGALSIRTPPNLAMPHSNNPIKAYSSQYGGQT